MLVIQISSHSKSVFSAGNRKHFQTRSNAVATLQCNAFSIIFLSSGKMAKKFLLFSCN